MGSRRRDSTGGFYDRLGLSAPDLSPFAFHGTKGGKTGILVQDIDIMKSNLFQQMQLIGNTAGGIFFVDIIKDLLPIFFSTS